MTPKERRRMKENYEIIGAAVDPDTNEVIPAFKRISSFILYNLPLLLIGRMSPTLIANDTLLLLS